MSLADVRQGLADNLATIRGVQISPYVLSNATAPFIWVKPSSETTITYHRAMGNGLETWSLDVQAYVGATSDIGAQKKLDSMLASSGADSVKAAIESDRTLGGAAQDLSVTECSGYREFARPDGSTLLGATWTVVVHMS